MSWYNRFLGKTDEQASSRLSPREGNKEKAEKTKNLALYLGAFMPPVNHEEIDMKLLLHLIEILLKMEPGKMYVSPPSIDKAVEEYLDE